MEAEILLEKEVLVGDVTLDELTHTVETAWYLTTSYYLLKDFMIYMYLFNNSNELLHLEAYKFDSAPYWCCVEVVGGTHREFIAGNFGIILSLHI